MSLDFDIAPFCNEIKCTNLLTSNTEFKNGYCFCCQWEIEKEKDES